MSELTIGLILPDVLGTYGDNGNALVLRGRARKRGIDTEVVTIKLGEPVPTNLDLYCVGGGEDTAQILAAKPLTEHRGLIEAANVGRPIFAICAGLQVLGESFRADGRIVDGVGLIDATTSSLGKRTIGELISTPAGIPELTDTLTGFENHGGGTVLGPDAAPLGRVLSGVGNGTPRGTTPPEVRYDGAVQGSIIATYMHGPALARNPELADLLLQRATGSALEPLEVPGVAQLRAERLRIVHEAR